MTAVTSPEERIRRTLAQYCQLCDDGRFDEWGSLFTEDTTYHVMGQSLTGRDEAKAFMERSQPPELRGQHVTANSQVVVADDGKTAQCWSDYVFFDQAGRLINRGRYHDELVCGDDGVWRFGLREIVFAGNDPELTSPPPG